MQTQATYQMHWVSLYGTNVGATARCLRHLAAKHMQSLLLPSCRCLHCSRLLLLRPPLVPLQQNRLPAVPRRPPLPPGQPQRRVMLLPGFPGRRSGGGCAGRGYTTGIARGVWQQVVRAGCHPPQPDQCPVRPRRYLSTQRLGYWKRATFKRLCMGYTQCGPPGLALPILPEGSLLGYT